MSSNIKIDEEDPDQPEIAGLLVASDRYHAALYPAESNHLVDLESLKQPHVRFLVMRDGHGQAIGCGSLVLSLNEGRRSAELKRMWINPAARGNGLGRALLERLEAVAADEGAELLRLETGISQPEAIGLYRAAGFRERGPFGDYREDPLSIFMEKPVTSSAAETGGRRRPD